MGKRKHHEEIEFLAQKIKKLERKMSRARRRRRHDSSISNNSDGSNPVEATVFDLEDSTGDTGATPEIHMATITNDSVSEATELDPVILSILGDEPQREEMFAPNIHKDIAKRWTDIMVNGLKEETKKELLKTCVFPENLKLAKAPSLNPEIKAAVTENAIRRDSILLEKQNQLACAISGVAKILSSALSTFKASENNNFDNSENSNDQLKSLSDIGRLLCTIHHSETITRRNFIMACLNKDIKDNIKDLKRDQLLFGSDLQEKLRSMKAISKTGAEMRPVKPKVPPKGRQGETSTATPRTLNWRGPPPAQAPRRVQARPNSTAGGRKQQLAARRPSDRRTPRYKSAPPPRH